MVSCSNRHGVFRLENGAIQNLAPNSGPKTILSSDHLTSGKFPDTANVSHIQVNDAGNLLAVAGDEVVSVWSIATVPPTNIAKINLESPVRGLQWHPAAKDDANLVVVTKHRITSAYCHPLFPLDVERLELIDDDNLKIDIGSVAFGSPDSPLGIANLYVSSSDGDVYRLSPFLPRHAALLPEQLNDLKRNLKLDDIVAEYNRWCNRRNMVVKCIVFRKQPLSSATATNICRSASVSALKLKPYPDVLYEEDSLDLMGGSIDWCADALIQLTQNFLNLYIALSNEQEGELCLVSSLRFKDTQPHRNIVVFADGRVITTTDDDAAPQIFDFSPLLNAWREGCQVLENTEDLVDVTNLSTGEMPYVTADGTICVLSGTGKLLRELPTSVEDEKMSEIAGAISNIKINEIEPGLYADPAYLPKTLKDLSTKIQPYKDLPPGLVFEDNAKSLLELNKISAHYQKQIVFLHKLMLRDDFARQARERDLAAQSSALEIMSKVVEKQTQVNQTNSQSAIKAVSDRNASFKERVKQVKDQLDTAANNQQKGVYSKAEQAWYEELATKLPAVLDQQTDMLSQLKQRLEGLKGPSTESGKSRPHIAKNNIYELQQKLREQSLALDVLKAQAESTTQRV